MIYDTCPECESTWPLHDCLYGPNRHLREECYECDWVGEVRAPEQRYISGVKSMSVGRVGGFTYEIFDGYGQPYTTSRGYPTAGEAHTKLKNELEQLNSREGGGPWTGVLWPATVVVKGEIVQ